MRSLYGNHFVYIYMDNWHLHTIQIHVHSRHTPLDEALSNKKLSFTSSNGRLMTIDDEKSNASIHVSGDGVEASIFTFLERITWLWSAI